MKKTKKLTETINMYTETMMMHTKKKINMDSLFITFISVHHIECNDLASNCFVWSKDF